MKLVQGLNPTNINKIIVLKTIMLGLMYQQPMLIILNDDDQ